ncbi:flavin reductase family protein [Aspergillus novofumigatus IBT 16806]|uniref:Putative oxidoreductase n=1 Tax=Aspergillus novofumigatus (strain IBT 16806) TaxID=1392255 RepID=A0A2I1C4E1_ASPN1|nr:putative oxidoreductase [Aspergillus novofumigatus IBT 16806]PKX92510.1 putative oxidoreductase [Aspergillus novofumigatus IBT 16806]
MKLPYSLSVLSAVNIKVEQQSILALPNRLSNITIRCGAPQQPWPRRQYGTSAHASQAGSEPKKPASARPALSLTDQVRLLMRRVPYPVAIITATDPQGPIDKAFRGMTVSSFNTVTLHPSPVISFNVRRPSETLTALQSSGRFLVHLLAPTPATATLARDFSRGNHNLALLSGKGDFEFVQHISADGSVTRPLPILRRRAISQTNTEEESIEDFPFVFECQLNTQRVEIYDHTIVVGTVVQALLRHLPESETATSVSSGSAKDLCLTYANTKFWEMGHEI